MAIEITITQKGATKKAMPLEVIIGDELRYGFSDGIRLEEDMVGDNHFVAYNPNHIGRGIVVDWKEGETYKVHLRLPIPSHDAEIDDFFDLATRIATYWKNCKIVKDRRKVMTVDDFVFQRSEIKEESLQTLSFICNQTKFDEAGNMSSGDAFDPSVPVQEGEICLQCARWPIVFGGKEKALLADSTDSTKFKEFLHEKLAIDAYYGKAFFSQHMFTKELSAKYVIEEDNLSIFPLKPAVPWWMIDRRTGETLEVVKWEIGLFSTTKDDMLGIIPYDDFITQFKNLKSTEYYDHQHVINPGMSLAQMQDFLTAGSGVVQ